MGSHQVATCQSLPNLSIIVLWVIAILFAYATHVSGSGVVTHRPRVAAPVNLTAVLAGRKLPSEANHFSARPAAKSSKHDQLISQPPDLSPPFDIS